MRKSETPISKLKSITRITRIITSEIDQHYLDVDFAGKASKLTIDADTLISICTYIILKAQVHEIYAHLKLGNQFATSFLRSSKLGFVASTFEVAIE